MAAASCSVRCPALPSPTKFSHSRCLPPCAVSSGAQWPPNACKSGVSGNFTGSSAPHYGVCKSGASQEFSVSSGGNHRDVASNSGCGSGVPLLCVRSSGAQCKSSVSRNFTASSGAYYRGCKSETRQDCYASSDGNHEDVASSSGCGTSGSLFFGGCGHPRRSWSAVVLLSTRRKSGRRRRNGHCSANSRAQEEAATVKEISDLSESLLSLKSVVTTAYRAIGPEMRGRVDRLYDRVIVLQQSADRAINSGSRMPTQLTANLIALQREHGSLENIVRLAMEAAPALASLEAAVSRTSTPSAEVSNLLLEEAKPKASVLEEAKPKASVFQSLIRESVVKPLKSAPPKYVMSAPASQGSSPLAAFRAEIERRVIEQLAGKKMHNPQAVVSCEVRSQAVVSSLADTSLLSSQPPLAESGAAIIEKQVPVDKYIRAQRTDSPQQNTVDLSALSAAEVTGTVALIENKLKQLELELAKSIPLHVFEQKVSKINTSLSEARAQVVQLTAEVTEKETMLTAAKRNMLAEQEQLMQKVRELTGDLEKKFSVEDMEAAVNFGLEELEKELEEEQDRTFLLSIELEKKEKVLVEQQETWRVMKEDMEKQLDKEQDRALSLSLELERKEKLMMEQEGEWKLQKMGLESELRGVQLKMHDVRRKRTKERAQLAEKKQKVKLLEQELSRVQESMEEADRIRLKKREATYATVRMLITQMVLSSRARAESEAHATTLVQEVAKLQEENQALELTRREAEEKAGLAEAEVEGIKSNLTEVGREVVTLQGELLSGEKVAALEKFFAIMGLLIKQESENMQESSPLSLEDDLLSENELLEDEGLHMMVDDNLASSGGKYCRAELLPHDTFTTWDDAASQSRE